MVYCYDKKDAFAEQQDVKTTLRTLSPLRFATCVLKKIHKFYERTTDGAKEKNGSHNKLQSFYLSAKTIPLTEKKFCVMLDAMLVRRIENSENILIHSVR